MTDAQVEQLVGCFKKVFPNLSRADILSATQKSVGAWDSIAHVTLISLIGEEFGCALDFEEFGEATSFAEFRDLLSATLDGSSSGGVAIHS
jgi:acyl carrier protein